MGSSVSTSAGTVWSFGMISIDLNGNWQPNWYIILYDIVAILIMANVGAWLWNRGQPIATALTMGLLFLTFIFFFLRWFPSTPSTPAPGPGCSTTSTPAPAKTFPPIVNMCPDFMVAWKDSTGTYCYDIHDTYNMKKYNGAGQKPITVNGVALYGYNVSDLPGLIGTATITNDANGKYLRWEGVWDGLSLTPQNIPTSS